ncbi:MAG TPA: hypothetical protein VFN49_06360 [Candidatus Aquilonibacter sp.]|nr:hypothetical protein [Candidatus Aquilonibacter sp.]
MTTQLGTSALETLERVGLCVHPYDGDHDHIGKHRRVAVRIDVSMPSPDAGTITLAAAGGTAVRQLPLTAFGAKGMVAELRDNALLHPSEHAARMLEHLLVHVARAAEHLKLRTLVLDPVAVADGGYCIDAAALTYHHSPDAPGIEYRLREGRDHVTESPRYHERP